MNETNPKAPFTAVSKGTPKYGVRIPNGFNGSQPDVLDALFQMAAATIQTNKLYHGFTMDLDRNALGEWRFSITPKERNV